MPPPPPGPGWGPRLTVHKPGIVALRPLTLSDFFEGATSVMRRNPRATIGYAALITLAGMVVPIIVTIALGAGGHVPSLGDVFRQAGTPAGQDAMVRFDVTTYGLAALALPFQWVADILITGVLVPTVARAATGEKLTAGQAWRLFRPRLWTLVGLAVVRSLFSLLLGGVLLGLVALVWVAGHNVAATVLAGFGLGLVWVVVYYLVGTRFFLLAPAAVVLEKRGLRAGLVRAGRLSRGQFWRLFGIMLLVSIVAAIVRAVIGVPFSLGQLALIAADNGNVGSTASALIGNVAGVVGGAITAPFLGAVSVLLYLDQRFRKEGFDLELIDHVQGRNRA